MIDGFLITLAAWSPLILLGALLYLLLLMR